VRDEGYGSGGLNSTRLFFLALVIVDQTRCLCKFEAGLSMTRLRQVSNLEIEKLALVPRKACSGNE
jgi:hypothetical protein